ncbi:MAG: Wzz/FepE/Etk N-terminal domain-containing protein, partial [Candidatus Omnitrophota bacterium]
MTAKKRKKVNTVFLCTVGAGLLSMIYSLFLPPVYKGVVQVVVNKPAENTAFFDNRGDVDQFLDNQYRILTSDAVLSVVVDKLHLGLSRKYMGKDALNELRKSIVISKDRDSSIITICVYMENPTLASRIATVLGEEYKARVDKINFNLKTKAATWLEETSDLSARIKDLEKRQSALSKAADYDSLQKKGKELSGRVDILERHRSQEVIGLNRLNVMIESLESDLRKNDIEGIFLDMGADEMAYELKRGRKSLEIGIQNIGQRKGESSPEFAAWESRLSALDKAILNHASDTVTAKKAEALRVENRLRELDKRIGMLNDEMESLKRDNTELDELDRELEAARDMHKQAKDELNDPAFSIIAVEGITLPDPNAVIIPVAPKVMRNTAWGLIAGFLIGHAIRIFMRM